MKIGRAREITVAPTFDAGREIAPGVPLELLGLLKPKSRPATVLIDEFDAGAFKGVLDGEEGAGLGGVCVALYPC